jgi:hypothetical protein
LNQWRKGADISMNANISVVVGNDGQVNDDSEYERRNSNTQEKGKYPKAWTKTTRSHMTSRESGSGGD